MASLVIEVGLLSILIFLACFYVLRPLFFNYSRSTKNGLQEKEDKLNKV